MKFTLPQSYIDDGLVRVNNHPTLPLRLYNYTEHCQFEKKWDEITLQCRGLVVDAEDNIVARPFRKFFNYEEHTGPLPAGSPEIIEKMDGSLGIVFNYEGKNHVATRGSFTSDQAQHAQVVLDTKYADAAFLLPSNQTHLFEIIYPGNRIVVDYGSEDDLVYLGSIFNETGDESPYNEAIESGYFKQPSRLGFPGTDLLGLKHLPSENREGFVLKWPNGFRLKMKFDEYKRLHKILTNTTERTLWEALSMGQDIKQIIEAVPDEFYQWVEQIVTDLDIKFKDIADAAGDAFEEVCGVAKADRKIFAHYATQWDHPGLLFGLLDNRDIKPMIWKLIKPPATKPFKIEI